jgi:hypothetical protein
MPSGRLGKTPSYQRQASGFRLPASGFRLPASDTGCRPEPNLEASGSPKPNAVHLDGTGHEHHRARFRTHHVARRQREDHRLHVIADDLVLYHSACSKKRRVNFKLQT